MPISWAIKAAASSRGDIVITSFSAPLSVHIGRGGNKGIKGSQGTPGGQGNPGQKGGRGGPGLKGSPGTGR